MSECAFCFFFEEARKRRGEWDEGKQKKKSTCDMKKTTFSFLSLSLSIFVRRSLSLSISLARSNLVDLCHDERRVLPSGTKQRGGADTLKAKLKASLYFLPPFLSPPSSFFLPPPKNLPICLKKSASSSTHPLST